MAKFFIKAQAPIGEVMVEANSFQEKGALIVFTTPIGQNQVKQVYAIAIDKVFSIERQPD